MSRIAYAFWLENEFTNSKDVFKNGFEYGVLSGIKK